MQGEEASKSLISSSFMWIFFALSTSMGMVFQFGTPFNKTLNNHYPLLLMATVTFYLGMALLLICFAKKGTTRPLNPTSARWIHRLGTATLAASFTAVLALSVLPAEACTTFANSTLLSPQAVSWALEWGLILLAIAMAYRLIREMPTSWFQQYIKVVLFTLSVAIAGVYTESLSPMASTINFSSVMYQTYRIHHFALVPFTFLLGSLLSILGVAAPDSLAIHYASVTFKEFFATLALSVGCVTLLIGVSLTVGASVLSSAMVSGVGDVIKAGAI